MSNQFTLPLLDLIGTVIRRDDLSPFIETGQILLKDFVPLQKSSIVISKDFVKAESINVVLYFHGYNAPPIEQYFKNRKFKDIIDASKKSFVFIAPQLGSKSEFLTSAKDAIAYVNRMLDMLVQFGPFTSAPKIKQLIFCGPFRRRRSDAKRDGLVQGRLPGQGGLGAGLFVWGRRPDRRAPKGAPARTGFQKQGRCGDSNRGRNEP